MSCLRMLDAIGITAVMLPEGSFLYKMHGTVTFQSYLRETLLD